MQVKRIAECISTIVKPVLNGHAKETKERIFKTDYHLMQVKRIAECISTIVKAVLNGHAKEDKRKDFQD